MIKWAEELGVVNLQYPNGITVSMRHDVDNNTTSLDVYFGGRNVNKEVYGLVTGEKGQNNHLFSNVDAAQLTVILNRVSNLTIRR